MLALFFEILTDITLPIIVVAALGFVLQRRMKFDVSTLSRLLVHVVLPAFLVFHLSTAQVPLADVATTSWFTVVQFLILIPIGWLVVPLLGLPKGLGPVMGLIAALANSGNYALPLVNLAFGSDYILHQAVILSLHSILVVTVGVVLLSYKAEGIGGTLWAALKTPMIPAVVLGLLMKVFGVVPPPAITIPLEIVAESYTGIALFALGAQLAVSRWSAPPQALVIGVAMRMLIAPLLTWVAVWALGFPEDIADLLVVVSAAPVGVLLAILCAERKNNPDLAAAAVFVSTLLSPIVVTAFIFATRLA